MDKLGFVIMTIGLSLADSDCLIVPIAVTALGVLTLWRGGYVK